MSQLTLKEKLKNGFSYVQILLTWSLEEAVQTADSMAARGYGLKKRTSYEHFQWRKRDTKFMAVLIALFVIPLLGYISFSYGKFSVYPELTSFEISQYEIIHLIFYCLYLLIPLIVEGREWLKWN